MLKIGSGNMNIPIVSKPTIETILEEEARGPELGYASDFIIETSAENSRILLAFAKEMSFKNSRRIQCKIE